MRQSHLLNIASSCNTRCIMFQKFERLYHEQLYSADVSQKAQFEYAWCLVRSKYSADIRKGILLLEDLYSKQSGSERRDCLYYLAIGNARIKVRHMEDNCVDILVSNVSLGKIILTMGRCFFAGVHESTLVCQSVSSS